MRWFDRVKISGRMLLGRAHANAQLDAELCEHLERQVAENIAAGMNAEEARYAAMRSFGNPALLREQTRGAWSWNWLENLLRDLRYGSRTLRRTPGFAVIAMVVMALGIGANVALFAVVRSVLLNPLPFHDPDRLVSLFQDQTRPTDKGNNKFLPVDAASVALWQSAARSTAEMAIVSPWHQYNVSADGGRLPEQVDAAWCSGNFFSVLGVTPALGRAFTQEDDRPEAAAAVVLSSSVWKRRYNGDAHIVGKSIWLDARPFTVIGVLPPWFKYEGKYGGGTVQLWTTAWHEAPPGFMRTFEEHGFVVVARLLPGATLAGLLSELSAVQKQIKLDHPGPGVNDAVNGRTMLDDTVNDYKTALYVLLAAAGCVLLIACLNVAGLLVARTAARGKEQAIRTALGGSRLRLLRERLVESLLLSVAGGGLGLLLAWGGVRWLVLNRQDMNRVESIHIDGAVVLFTVGLTLLCALFSGLIYAVSSREKHILVSLKESSRAHSGGRARAGLRKTLLVLEVSLTVVLLVGAGLLLKSYRQMRSVDLGVPVDNVLTMHVSLPGVRYQKPAQKVAFFEQLIGRVRALPGVQSAGLVSTAPGQDWGGDNQMHVVEHPPLPKGQGFDIMVHGADPGYLAAAQIPLLRGRNFTSDERLDRADVVVISQAAARLLFPGEDPVGKHLHDDSIGGVFEVIGVASDVRWYPTESPYPSLYWPIYGNGDSVATIVIRSGQDVEALALPVEKVIGAMDPDLPVSGVMTLRQTIDKSTLDSQFDSLLVLAFALIALVLAAAGLYGVLAYLVAQRTSEIGIRMALGAQRQQVLRKILLDGMQPALIGLLLGVAGSAVVVRSIQSMLYQTQPLDAAVFVAVAATLLAVALFACLVPAWRASRLDPMKALRTE